MMKKSRSLVAVLLCFILMFTAPLSVFAEGGEGKEKLEGAQNSSVSAIEEILNEIEEGTEPVKSDDEESSQPESSQIEVLQEKVENTAEPQEESSKEEVADKEEPKEESSKSDTSKEPENSVSQELTPEPTKEPEVAEEKSTEVIEPKTVKFSDAGPFLPGVNIGGIAKFSAQTRANGDGLEVSKDITYDSGTGKYKIKLESYVTGEVVTTVKTEPVDIVLVLDQSGSMADNIQSGVKRQAAMKTAVNKFIDGVAAKYNNIDSDHRISIVTFESNATQKRGWTFVDPSSGQGTLKSTINALPTNPSGATRIDLGMKEAEKLINNPAYTGPNPTRKQVVIVFTDGYPTSSSIFNGDDFEINVANDALAKSKTIKDKGATVYSVGIFGGANPSEMHGSKYRHYEWSWFSWNFKYENTCVEAVNQRWGWRGKSDNSVYDADIAAANRFLNILSSNVSSESALGATRDYDRAIVGIGTDLHYWTINKPIVPDKTGYYLSASDTTSLDDVFQSIQEQIATPSIVLGTDAVMIDKLSDAMMLPAGTTVNDIKVYTADKNATTGWDAPVALINPDVEIIGKEIKVKGFDYSENFVSDNPRGTNNDFYGKKLIVEFEVEPDNSNTFGGNGIETNTSDSGIYKDDTPIGEFPVPKANFPVNYQIDTEDQTIYLGNEAELAGLLKYATGYQPNGSNNVGVDIVYELYSGTTKAGTYTIPAGAVAGDSNCVLVWETAFTNGKEKLADCKEYELKCTVTPVSAQGGNSGTSSAINLDKKANVHVLVPQIKFEDAKIRLGKEQDLKDLYQIDPVWVDANSTHTSIPAPIGTKPALNITVFAEYDFKNGSDMGTLTGSDFTPFKVGDYNFKIAVKIGNDDVTAKCKLTYPTCTTGSHASDRHFTVHVENNELTIEIDDAEGSKGQSFIIDVILNSAESNNFPTNDYKYKIALVPDALGKYKVVLKDLPVGTYTIKFDENWEWRYMTGAITTKKLQGGSEVLKLDDRKLNKPNHWLGSPAISTVNNFENNGPTPGTPPAISIDIFSEVIN